MILSIMQSGEPVSYTHLDVYKRQAYDEINGKTFSMSMGDNNSANITIADDGSVTVDGGLTVRKRASVKASSG